MVSWRCPHCGTPQKETARCWVCHRSTTCCSTCRHFRQGVTARLGYCAKDKARRVMTGAEERACWEPAARETHEIRTSGEAAAVAVTPWAEADAGESAEFEHEPAAAGARPKRRIGRDPDERLGFGLIGEADEEDPFGADFDQGAADSAPFAPQAPASDDLWSLYLEGPSPVLERRRDPADATVRSAGMWVETFKTTPAPPPPQAPLTARHRNVRSVRHRPWGPVPGREDAYVRTLRVPDKVRRPGL